MTDRNRWDDDRRWKSGSDYRDDDEHEFRSGRTYGGQRQSWQQDYSGEFDRDRYGSDYGSADYGSSDYASRRAGGGRYSQGEGYRSGQSYGGAQSQRSRQSYASDDRYRSGSSYRAERPRYDEGSQYQTSERRYSGTGASYYGAGSSGGDYFTGSDYGSGAHAWDRGASAYGGSGRYGSTYSQTGYTGEIGSTASYAPGSHDRDTSRQSYQREMSGGFGQSGHYDRGAGYGQERGFLERASDEVMSWFGDEDAARRREQDHRGQGPSDYTRSDERIREDANDRLTDDWRVDARKISVTVRDGELTLSGTVPSRDAKRRAEDCVEDISGVKHVQNNLRVDATSGNATVGQSNWSATSTTAGTGGQTTGSTKATSTPATPTTPTTTSTTGAAPRGTTTGSTSA